LHMDMVMCDMRTTVWISTQAIRTTLLALLQSY
jgi:hypothetical protein